MGAKINGRSGGLRHKGEAKAPVWWGLRPRSSVPGDKDFQQSSAELLQLIVVSELPRSE
jgi:hypothetical protein